MAKERDAGQEWIAGARFPARPAQNAADQVTFPFFQANLAYDLAIRESGQAVEVARTEIAQGQVESERELIAGVKMRRGGDGDADVLILDLGQKSLRVERVLG
jgi:hypothetical protein